MALTLGFDYRYMHVRWTSEAATALLEVEPGSGYILTRHGWELYDRLTEGYDL